MEQWSASIEVCACSCSGVWFLVSEFEFCPTFDKNPLKMFEFCPAFDKKFAVVQVIPTILLLSIGRRMNFGEGKWAWYNTILRPLPVIQEDMTSLSQFLWALQTYFYSSSPRKLDYIIFFPNNSFRVRVERFFIYIYIYFFFKVKKNFRFLHKST